LTKLQRVKRWELFWDTVYFCPVVSSLSSIFFLA